MIVTEVFKGAMTATAHVEGDVVAVAIVHENHEPAVFEMNIDKISEFYILCKRMQAGEIR